MVLEVEKMEYVKQLIRQSGSFIAWPRNIGEVTSKLPLFNYELCAAMIKSNKGDFKAPSMSQLRVVTKLLLEVFMARQSARTISTSAKGLKRMYTASHRRDTRKQTPRVFKLHFK